jgi:type I restriction enzyme S subunit
MAYWLRWLFCSQVVKGQVAFLQTGAGREGLNFEQVGDVQVPIPPPGERFAVVAFLDRAIARVDLEVAKVEHSIKLLHEYRAAIVTAAVTGKIDLRNEGRGAAT